MTPPLCLHQSTAAEFAGGVAKQCTDFVFLRKTTAQIPLREEPRLHTGIEPSLMYHALGLRSAGVRAVRCAFRRSG